MNIYAQKEKFKYVVAFAWNYGNLAPSSTICRDFVFFNNVKFRAQRISQDTQDNIWISWNRGKSFLISTSSPYAKASHVSGSRDIVDYIHLRRAGPLE